MVVAVAATLLTSTVEATPVAFTLNSTASTLDLTAKYIATANTASITVAEQSAGSKAAKYSSPAPGSVKTDLYPTGIDFPGGSIAHASNQSGNLKPGVGGTGAAAAGNYGIYIAYPFTTPIVLPVIDLGLLGTKSPGTITGAEIDIALRNLDLDFKATPTFHPPLVGAGPTFFDASDVSVDIAAGNADVSVNAILNITSLTGGNAFLAAIYRPLLISLLTQVIAGYLPPDSGVVITLSNGVGAQEMLIGTGSTQSLVGSLLANDPASQGKLEHIGTDYKLTLPVKIDLAAVLPDNPLIASSDLTLTLTGQMVATAPYVTAVPEPSTLALAGVGLLSFLGYSVRKRRMAS
jgi:hypothetical protein